MTERRVVWSHAAEHDLEAIVDYIAEQQPATALKVFERLRARTDRLSSQTLRGRRVPELRQLGIDSHHEIIEAPWRIIYRPASDRVLVVAIFDARRDIQGVLMERLLQLR
ncbi:MAG: type II toxin-antitoxin system RelE/ParE family toxin [Rhodanobacter sp.]